MYGKHDLRVFFVIDHFWFGLGHRGDYRAQLIWHTPEHAAAKNDLATSMRDHNPYVPPPPKRSERDFVEPVVSRPRRLTPIFRAVVVFFFGWYLVSILLILFSDGSSSPMMRILLPVVCLLITILPTWIDTIQYKRPLRKRDNWVRSALPPDSNTAHTRPRGFFCLQVNRRVPVNSCSTDLTPKPPVSGIRVDHALTCGFPGAVSKLSWKYSHTDGDGDHYHSHGYSHWANQKNLPNNSMLY